MPSESCGSVPNSERIFMKRSPMRHQAHIAHHGDEYAADSAAIDSRFTLALHDPVS
jgi:hypothetical protein